MDERRASHRARMWRGGKILFNSGRSVLDCTVRDLSPGGACLQVESLVGVPPAFELLIDREHAPRPCRLVWQSDHRAGVQFALRRSGASPDGDARPAGLAAIRAGGELIRNELLGLRAALDEAKFGVVLLDAELRAQFINRAFRRMWRLPDGKADSRPAFVALMYHGRDTRAYDLPESELDAYVAERVADVKAGNPAPRDIRLANGEVLRFQCTALPSGGRVLSYTSVTDIVRHSDELEVLRAALDNVEPGIILLDAQFHVQFMNAAARKLAGISAEQAEAKPHFSQLVNNTRLTGAYDVPPGDLDAFIARRIELVKTGDPTPIDLRLGNGRIVRAQCALLPDGGRMLTYTDVTDLVRHAEELERLATTDGMTGLANRRHFLALAEAEWSRFQRYHRPLTLLLIDLDRLKTINDRFGHAAGDMAMVAAAETFRNNRRGPDIVARIGGDEFAMLLPETEAAQGQIVADRLRQELKQRPLAADDGGVTITVSVGLAQATLSMPNVDALMKAADRALYRAKATGRDRAVVAVPRQETGFNLAAE
ncbi:MAG TPA: diguanylate cyclase [Xanthobacteraceae bacterium]|nr:diguanylate cyclase [Xanthobacteraceae bacterium]